MKQYVLILILFSFAVFFSSCDTNQIECIRVSSNIISETRDIRDYNGVVMNAVGVVKLIQGQDFAFKITGPDNVVELTKAEIQNDLLVIGTGECFNGNYELTIEITAPEFEVINLSGVGTIESMNTINGDIIEVELLGIGVVEADFVADSVYSRITGQGNLIYSGDVKRHELNCTGEFVFKGFSLVTDHTIINVSGIGDSEVTVEEKLDVIIEGMGNVFYKGYPAITSEIIGTGEIIDKN